MQWAACLSSRNSSIFWSPFVESSYLSLTTLTYPIRPNSRIAIPPSPSVAEACRVSLYERMPTYVKWSNSTRHQLFMVPSLTASLQLCPPWSLIQAGHRVTLAVYHPHQPTPPIQSWTVPWMRSLIREILAKKIQWHLMVWRPTHFFWLWFLSLKPPTYYHRVAT